METILLSLVAASMAGITAWVLRRGSDVRTANQAIVLLLILSMMGSMFLSAVVYLYYPGFTNLIILVAFNMVTMSVFLVPALLTMINGDRNLEDLLRGSPVKLRTVVVWAAIAFVFAAEVFMGWTLSAVAGALQPAGNPAEVYLAVIGSSSSYWFVFTMAAEMALTFATMRKRFLNGMLWVVGVQPLMMFFSPTAIDSHAWAELSFIANAVIMATVFAFILGLLRRNRSFSRATMAYLLCLILAYTVMMAGLLIWFADGDAAVFVASLYFEMAVYMYVILDGKSLGLHREDAQPPAGARDTPTFRVGPPTKAALRNETGVLLGVARVLPIALDSIHSMSFRNLKSIGLETGALPAACGRLSLALTQCLASKKEMFSYGHAVTQSPTPMHL